MFVADTGVGGEVAMKHSILSEGEHVRRAVRWISYDRLTGTNLTALQLVGDAAVRFDLSPLEEDWVLRMLVEHLDEDIDPDTATG